MQKHHLLLHSGFSLSPFKLSLCCLLHEAFSLEVLDKDITHEAITYVADQIAARHRPGESANIEKTLATLTSEVKARVMALGGKYKNES